MSKQGVKSYTWDDVETCVTIVISVWSLCLRKMARFFRVKLDGLRVRE
jgi:hypothetical protein